MWDNVSMINCVHMLKLVKGFEPSLGYYGSITLKELYGSHSLIFNSLVESEIVPDRTAQYPFLRP